MPFDARDLRRGLIAAWLVFTAEAIVALVVQGLTSPAQPAGSAVTALMLYGVPVAAVASGLVVLFAAPLAWLLARALARVRGAYVHLLAFAALGAAAALMAAVIFLSPSGAAPPEILGSATALTVAAPAAVAAAAGWAWAASRVGRHRGGPPAARGR